MPHFADYRLGGRIWPGTGAEAYSAVRESDGLEVALRVLPAQHDAEARARGELELRSSIATSGCLNILGIARGDAGCALVLERFAGVSLDEYAREHAPSSDDFLVLALALATTVREIHDAGVVLGGLSVSRILIDPLDRRMRIWDLSVARRIDAGSALGFEIDPTQHHLSPEHTERLPLPVGPWSDLYGVGAVLYQLATGQPIFDGPWRELRAQILTRVPTPAHEINPTLPIALSRMLAKLVQKHAQDRYASAHALELDLIEFREQLARYGSIEEELTLGANERPWVLGDRVIGRDAELDLLRSTLTRVESGGRELSVLVGPPGIGKRSLTGALVRDIATSDCRVLRGAFAERESLQPYGAFAESLRSLVRQVRLEGSTQPMLEDPTLGGLSGVLTSWIPELQAFLHVAEVPIKLRGSRARFRLQLALERLFRQLSSSESPLVWVLENLELADLESKEALSGLLTCNKLYHFWVIATCNAIDRAVPDPIEALLHRSRETGARSEVLQVGPMAVLPTATWAAEHGLAPPDAERIAALTRSASGNPLELRLRLVLRARQIDAAASLEHASDDRARSPLRALFGSLARGLGDEVFEVLSRAALWGWRDVTLESDARPIRLALGAGLIEPSPEGLRFCHPELRAALCVGSTPRRDARGSDAAGASQASETMSLERARQQVGRAIRDPSCIGWELLPRFSVCAEHALGLGAVECASRAAILGADAFPDPSAAPDPAAWFELQLLAVGSELSLGRPVDAEARIERLRAWAQSTSDIVRIELVALRSAQRRQGPRGVLDSGLAALRRLGIRARLEPTMLRVRWTHSSLARALMAVSPDVFVQKAREVPHARDAMDLIDGVLPVITWLHPGLGLCLAARRIRTALQHGSTTSPAKALVAYARCVSLLFQDHARAARIAQLGLQVDARWPDSLESPRTQLSAHLLSLSWVSHRRRILEPLDRVYEGARQLGDQDAVALTQIGAASAAFVSGEPLSVVERRLRIAAARLSGLQHPLSDIARQCHQHIRKLIEPEGEARASERDADWLSGGEAAHLSGVGRSLIGTVALAVDYFDGRHEDLHRRAQKLDPLAFYAFPLLPHVSEYLLYLGITAGILAQEATGKDRRRHLRTLHGCLAKFTRLAIAGPDNFEHQALLLEAESLRAAGKLQSSLALYARAADRADAQGYRNHAALALERRAAVSLEMGLVAEGAALLHEAITLLDEWGARAAASRLKTRYHSLLSAYPALTPRVEEAAEPSLSTTSQTATSTHRTTGEAATLDLATVLRSSEAISSEVDLERVIERVLTITIENGGAQRAVLLLDHDTDLRVEAERNVSSGALRHDPAVPLVSAGALVPINLVQYVQRTRRSVVLRDAASDGLFVDDPYVSRGAIRSVLCVPILRQGRLVGALYLENALVSDAFTSGRVEVLRMLSSHAAISLDNARLYSELTHLNRDLEARIEERTEKLREARDAAQAATQAKSEFLAVMSHEIRTPMNVVIGMAQIMLDTELTSDQRDCVRAIHTAGDSLLNVINDILDFSKIEVGKLELEHVPFSLRACIEDVAEILAPKAYAKGLEFPVFIQRSTLDDLIGDANRLKQVVINFVNNAIKFTETGFVTIRVEPLELAADRVRLRFEVRDTGIGIPKNRLDRLFQSFSQVDASTTRKYGGTGLGLVISKRLVEAMGGSVGVDSVEGEGSSFWFEAVFGLDTARAAASREDLSAARALVLSAHREAGLAIAEQILQLGCGADAVTTLEEARQHLSSAAEADRGYTVVMLRCPFEEPGAAAFRDELRAQGRLSVCLISTLHERAAVEAEHSLEDVGWLMRPIKGAHLRRALATSIGVELTECDETITLLSPQVREVRSRYRILVAEDYPLNRKLASYMLSRGGYGFELAEDGRKALEAVESQRYDLILMDCQMPEIDGFTATRQIRKREGTEGGGHVPIIAMTANAMKGDRERCLDAGMDDYLSKPIQLVALYAMLQRYLPDDTEAAPAE